MSTAVALLAVLVGCLLAVVVVLAVMVSRRRRVERRTTQQLAALQERLESMAATVARLERERSEPGPGRGSQRSDASENGVPVITGIADRDDLDLDARRVASITLAGPLLKAAAFSYGVRHALHEEQRMRITYAMRKELRRQRKMRRRRRAQRSRSEGWVP